MDWRIEDKQAFSILAMKRHFNEENAGKGIPAFYKEYSKSDLKYKVAPKIGVCITPDLGADWIYAIGDIFYNGLVCPDGFEAIEIKAKQWAVFSGDTSEKIMNYIYSDWFINSGYEILPGETLEFYNENGEIYEIWIPSSKR